MHMPYLYQESIGYKSIIPVIDCVFDGKSNLLSSYNAEALQPDYTEKVEGDELWEGPEGSPQRQKGGQQRIAGWKVKVRRDHTANQHPCKLKAFRDNIESIAIANSSSNSIDSKTMSKEIVRVHPQTPLIPRHSLVDLREVLHTVDDQHPHPKQLKEETICKCWRLVLWQQKDKKRWEDQQVQVCLKEQMKLTELHGVFRSSDSESNKLYTECRKGRQEQEDCEEERENKQVALQVVV